MELRKNEKVSANTVELEIGVGREEFEAACQTAYRRDVGKINVPGFRRGKAPRKMIEKMYGESVFYEDAVNIAYPEAYRQAVEAAGIEPVDRADIEVLEVSKDGFAFKAKVTVKPEVTLGDYQSIRVEKKTEPVTDSDIDAELSQMAERSARIAAVEREAGDGDIAVIDYEGFQDGKAFEGGKAEHHSLKLGSGQFIPGFEEQIVGHKAGDEFDVNVTFPGEYHDKELAGKQAVFKVKLHEVRETIVPAIDDEFAKDVSEFETLSDLRADVKSKLEKTREQNAEHAFEDEVLDRLVGVMEADIPHVMIESRVDSAVEDFSYRMSAQGITLDKYLQMTGTKPEDLHESFHPRAERQVKISLALEKLASLENISASDEEVEAEYAKLATGGMTVEQVKNYLTPEAVRRDVVTEKAVKRIQEIAQGKAAGEEKAPEAPAAE